MFLDILMEFELLLREFQTNQLLQLEFLSATVVVVFVMWLSYVGLKYEKIRNIFSIHNVTDDFDGKKFISICLDAPILSGNGIAMWRIYFSLPLIFFTIISYQNPAISSLLLQAYVFLFATDALDGAVCRKLNNVSRVGKILDPLADKMLDLPILLTVCYYSNNKSFMIIALFIVIFDILGQLFRGRVSNPAANWVGKTKTVLKVVSIYLISLNRFEINLYDICFILLVLSLIFTFTSFWLKVKDIF